MQRFELFHDSGFMLFTGGLPHGKDSVARECPEGFLSVLKSVNA
jgi:hypothetical protein